MSESQYGEKYEKEEEKSEKEHEKDEKTWDEKWRRDPLSAIVWAIILIWAGVVFLASNMGFLGGLGMLESWPIVLVGAGVIVLLEAAVRVLVPTYRRPIGGTLFFGFILIGIGLGDLLNTNLVWPLILIAFGLSLLLRGFFKNR